MIQGGSGDLIIVITCVHRPRSFSHVGEVSFSPIAHAAAGFFFEGQSLQRYEGRFLYCKIQFPLVKIMSQDTAMVGARTPATGISTALQIRSPLRSPLRYTASIDGQYDPKVCTFTIKTTHSEVCGKMFGSVW